MWNRRRQLPMVFQAEGSECGLACLTMIAWYHGQETSIDDLRKLFPVSLKGLSMRGIIDAARQLGFKSRVMRCDLDQLPAVKTPAMLHWDLEHLVVLKQVRRNTFTIHDPAKGTKVLRRDEISNHFTGIVLELEPADDFSKVARGKKLTLFDVLGSLGQWKTNLIQILLLSALLELLLLTQPIIMRTIVDNGIANKDEGFILRAAGLLMLAALLHGATNFIRDYAALRAGTTLNQEMMQRVFRQAIRLPLAFFEKRPIGHLIERYRVTDEIERFMLGTLPLGLIDGLMTLLSITMVFRFSSALGAVSLLTAAAYFVLKSFGYQGARSREQALVFAKGEENGILIETLSTIFTTKVNGIEGRRYQSWLHNYGRLIHEQKRSGKFEIAYRSLKFMLVGLNVALFVLLAGNQVAGGLMTIGTLLAAIFYNSHFLTRATLLVERFFEFRILGVRLERLEDLILAEPESPEVLTPALASSTATPVRRPVEWALSGELAVESLSFRYSPMDAVILDKVNLRIAPGEFVAIIGENGAGKTTLLKLLLGLYRPTDGRIQYDSKNLQEMSLAMLRSQIGVVTQDDQLFNGTLAENIALLDPEIDIERVAACAELACVRQDIERMPMAYNTRVGQLSSPLSEGQKQKVLLARALYRKPRILMLDEGTANIDAQSERQILDHLQNLDATKIIIAHRSATIERADRVLLLRNGQLTEMAPRALDVVTA
ncbi:ABC transporter [Cystobacter fuscus]|uniref:ABC transporter n=1 Tax=Cystobacter fuscus TaxID=43 RepID=A0A250J6P4_9BACT|nr:peptidase domain-containing ABC transporter [Cystobacter fuscus]ATB39200.1 ABC transporter [Cystobacter fuscus]